MIISGGDNSLDLDIVILYLLVTFFVIYIFSILFHREGFDSPNITGIATYYQQLAITTMNNAIRNLESRLATIRRNIDNASGAWVRNYWVKRAEEHNSKISVLISQLTSLIAQVNSQVPVAPVGTQTN